MGIFKIHFGSSVSDNSKNNSDKFSELPEAP